MSRQGDAAPRPLAGRIARGWWMAVGFLCVGVGSVGVIVPGLPTTVFFVVAAWCFGRSSPRFEQWVLGLPKIGPMVRDYRDGLGMPRRAKVIALTTMWAAVASSSWLLRDRWPLSVTVLALGLVGTVVVAWRVPTRERELARRAAQGSTTTVSPT